MCLDIPDAPAVLPAADVLPTEMTEEVILNPPKIDIKLKPENVDIAYPPLFQSGGQFDLKLSAGTDDNALHGGEVKLGAKGGSQASVLMHATSVP